MVGRVLTAMNMEASNEKQNPISAKDVRKASGRCLPSLSISAFESVQADEPDSVSSMGGPFCLSSVVEDIAQIERGARSCWAQLKMHCEREIGNLGCVYMRNCNQHQASASPDLIVHPNDRSVIVLLALGYLVFQSWLPQLRFSFRRAGCRVV